jgi:predicted nuclease of predicted toxin-antitoxin system
LKLVFDQNRSHRLCTLLADVAPQSDQVRKVGLDCASDLDIWAFVQRESFAIVTLDADFADLAALRGAPAKVIWLRCGNQPTSMIEHLLRDSAQLIEAFLKDETASCFELY